ncbi:hypothetical protein [Caldisericum exile]|uniref:Uncharacterized protein n=1 Tax=Caldisericum exile (strain DSM 21853 / NBRC 104410 / AZM16c01) TaxID=511051 RepID=A0A7U6GFF3_CALEA|nr:hypothetical protein [Caldisericum exile]BAL81422.1 hypothetical protein CSE_12960 [Caldisericum exile AZM16c01]
MLDEFVKLTGYSRCCASYLLRTYGKKVVVDFGDNLKGGFLYSLYATCIHTGWIETKAITC